MNYQNIVLSANHFISTLADLGNKILFFNIFPFFGIKLPFLIAWLLAISFVLFFKTKMFNFKFLFLAARYSFSKRLENSQIKIITKTKGLMQTSKSIALFGAGSNADLGSVFGVALAITVGGRGVIFWMIVIALISSAIRLVEVFISHSTRQIDLERGVIIGGPQFYIQTAFERYNLHKFGKFFSYFFSISLIISTLCSPQINQTVMIITYFKPSLAPYTFFIALTASLMVLTTLLGGFNMITKLSQKVIPIVGIVYTLLTFLIIFVNRENLVPSLRGIFLDAISLKAGIGGIMATIVIATQRSIFCSENGMGSSSISHLTSANRNSFMESVISTITPVLSVMVISICSGLIVIITNTYKSTNASGIAMVADSFATVHPHLRIFLVLIIPLFGLSTAMAWSYYGQKVWINIFGNKTKHVYNAILFVSYCICGSSNNFSSILALADVCNLSITIPHLFSVLLLLPVFGREIAGKFSKPLVELEKDFNLEIDSD